MTRPSGAAEKRYQGRVLCAIEDDTFQIIPTAWALAAQERWTPYPPAGQCMSSMGVDPAGGGFGS